MASRQRIHVDQLRVGIYVRLTESWRNHPFLFNSFKIKDDKQRQEVRRLGLTTIRFCPSKSDAQPRPLTPDAPPGRSFMGAGQVQ